MAHIPTPNGVKVCMRYTQSGEDVCNVFHVNANAEPTEAMLDAIAQAFFDWWSVEMRPLQHAATSLTAIEVTDISGPDEEGIIFSAGLPLAGTHSGGSLPNNVTLATKLATGLTGRSRRGRSYLVGLPDSMLETGSQTVADSYITLLQGAFADLLTALAVEGFNLAVLSLISGGVPRTEGVLTDVTSVVTNDVVDSQRRRLPGRGS